MIFFVGFLRKASTNLFFVLPPSSSLRTAPGASTELGWRGAWIFFAPECLHGPARVSACTAIPFSSPTGAIPTTRSIAPSRFAAPKASASPNAVGSPRNPTVPTSRVLPPWSGFAPGVPAIPVIPVGAIGSRPRRYKISAHLNHLPISHLCSTIPRISSPGRYKISPRRNSLSSWDFCPRPSVRRYKRTS